MTHIAGVFYVRGIINCVPHARRELKIEINACV